MDQPKLDGTQWNPRVAEMISDRITSSYHWDVRWDAKNPTFYAVAKPSRLNGFVVMIQPKYTLELPSYLVAFGT